MATSEERWTLRLINRRLPRPPVVPVTWVVKWCEGLRGSMEVGAWKRFRNLAPARYIWSKVWEVLRWALPVWVATMAAGGWAAKNPEMNWLSWLFLATGTAGLLFTLWCGMTAAAIMWFARAHENASTKEYQEVNSLLRKHPAWEAVVRSWLTKQGCLRRADVRLLIRADDDVAKQASADQKIRERRAEWDVETRNSEEALRAGALGRLYEESIRERQAEDLKESLPDAPAPAPRTRM